MNDYLKIEYDVTKKPITNYPGKLAKHIFEKFELKNGQRILELGSGRAELLKGFKDLGLITYAIDSAPSAEKFATENGSHFESFTFEQGSALSFFEGIEFDVIFSKSFIEHLANPEELAISALKRLKPGGKFIALTPDFESNFKIFYDDITHVKPFTKVALRQMLELSGYQKVESFTFRQLPSTWNSRFMNFLAFLSGKFAHRRVKNKWFRWSRELMIAGIGVRPLDRNIGGEL